MQVLMSSRQPLMSFSLPSPLYRIHIQALCTAIQARRALAIIVAGAQIAR